MDYFVEYVLLHHSCPVCGYKTDEIHEKAHYESTTYRTSLIRYYFKKELSGKREFSRYKITNLSFLSCPQCGVFLSAEQCESEEKSPNKK